MKKWLLILFLLVGFGILYAIDCEEYVFHSGGLVFRVCSYHMGALFIEERVKTKISSQTWEIYIPVVATQTTIQSSFIASDGSPGITKTVIIGSEAFTFKDGLFIGHSTAP